MALSSEHREIWVAEVQTAREDVAEDTRKNLEPFPDQVAKVAVADHLAACEALLREIGSETVRVDDHDARISLGLWRNWQARIAALLGPTAKGS